MNNFLLLQEDDEQAFNNGPQNDRVYSQIESQLSVLRFFGSVLNMYLPVMADTVLNIAGGGTSSMYNSSSLLENEDNDSPSTESLGPDSLDSDPIR